MWRSRIPKLKTTFPSEVLAAYRNLTFDNVLARQVCSFCYRARLNFQAFFVAWNEMLARRGHCAGQKMSYRFSFCWPSGPCSEEALISMCQSASVKIFIHNNKIQRRSVIIVMLIVVRILKRSLQRKEKRTFFVHNTVYELWPQTR